MTTYKPLSKFKIGDKVSTFHGRVGIITDKLWSEGEYDDAQWTYCLDSFGWLFFMESELKIYTGEEKNHG